LLISDLISKTQPKGPFQTGSEFRVQRTRFSCRFEVISSRIFWNSSRVQRSKDRLVVPKRKVGRAPRRTCGDRTYSWLGAHVPGSLQQRASGTTGAAAPSSRGPRRRPRKRKETEEILEQGEDPIVMRPRDTDYTGG